MFKLFFTPSFSQPIRDSSSEVENLIEPLTPFTEYTFRVTATKGSKESAVTTQVAITREDGL